jgi:hypothetical protein
MPISDWQFWVVTIIGLVGLWLVIKPLLPKRGGSDGCTHCGSGNAAKKKSRRVALTVERKHVTK